VAKRLQSTYLPGQRTRNWLKTKHYQRETFLVGGFVPDRDQVRSLLVGLPTRSARAGCASPAGSTTAWSRRPGGGSGRCWPRWSSRSPSWAGSRGGCATLPGAA
jgi:hypothetical protein